MENGKPQARRQLSPEEKWEIFLEVTSQEISQADAARKYGVDVSVIIRLRALAKDAALAAFASAKPGRVPSPEQVRAGGGARGERSAVGGVEGVGGRADVAPGKAALGLFGPVPARVSAETKLELLGLIDGAVKDGWAHTRACRVLDLPTFARTAGVRGCGRPAASRTAVRSASAVHRLLSWEEQAILDLIEKWGWVDRSHRKLAHRGSYTGTVFVSPSTLLRVALKHRVELPGEPFRPRPRMPAFPEVPWEKNRIWIWDASHFTRAQAGRVRDRRRRHPLLDRLPAHHRADPHAGAAAVRPRARGPGAARPRRAPARATTRGRADPRRVV